MPFHITVTDQLVATRYELLDRVGAGGVANIYRARDRRLDRIVALKVLRPELAQDAELVERFQREARFAAGLNHPNVVHVFDYGAYDGSAFMAMEFVDGESVKERIHRLDRLPADQAVPIARDVLSALAAAHAQGLVHRDVKPQNVLITREGFVKLTDFGIAQDPSAVNLTQHGTTIGTAAYISPEQATGKPVGPAADVYGVGLLLYEMLTGRQAFEGGAPMDVVSRQVHEPPTPPSRLVPDIPAEVEAVVIRALEKDPRARYPSADAMLDALGAASLLPSGATERVARYDAPAVTQPVRRALVAPPPVVVARRRSSLIPLVLGLALLALLGGLFLLAERRFAAPASVQATATTRPAPTEPPPAPTQEHAAPAVAPTQAPAPSPTPQPPQPTAVVAPSPTAVPPQPTPTLPAPTATRPAAPTPSPAPTKPVGAARTSEVTFEYNNWQGAFRNAGESLYRGRSAAWVYGTGTQYSTMTARFQLSGAEPKGDAALVVMGLISDNSPQVDVAILVNDQEIYRGPAPFQNDNLGGDYTNGPAPWTEHSFEVPDGLLHTGMNTVTVKNLESSDNVGRPWFMVDWAKLQFAY